MRTVSIKEAKTMIGEIIPCVKGRIRDVWKYSTGVSDKGEWKIQNLLIEDETGSIKVFISGRAEIPASTKGEEITIESASTKHGLQGIKVTEEEYQGKKNIQLKITPAASIVIDGQPTTGSVKPSKQEPVLVHIETQNGNGDANVQKVRKRLMQLVNLYDKCWDAATFLGNKHNWETQLRKDVSSCLFITGIKEGLADALPSDKPVNGNGHATKKPDPSPEAVEDDIGEWDSAKETVEGPF